MENSNMNCDPIICERIQELRDDWIVFSKGLIGWKSKIENDIRKSKEYENVISRAETVVVDIHKKKQQNSSEEDLTEVRYYTFFWRIFFFTNSFTPVFSPILLHQFFH